MKNPFRRKPPQLVDTQVLSADDLKKTRANDQYKRQKKVADPMYGFISLVIKFLPVICLSAIGFLVYYYVWSSKKDLSALASLCTNVLVYVAGIVSYAMNDALKNKNDE